MREEKEIRGVVFERYQKETKTQYFWIEINREWLIEQNLYKPPPRTKEEADIMLRLLIHGCRAIKRPKTVRFISLDEPSPV